MPISFNEVPANLRVPGWFVEFDGSGAAVDQGVQPFKILVISQKLAAGTTPANTPIRITSAGQAAKEFGEGSILHGMALRLFANNKFTETWMVAMDDPGAGVAATGSIQFTATSPKAGTAYIYVAGRRLQVGVTTTSTASELATALAAAINADTTIPATAAVNGGDDTQVDITARHKGTLGNWIDLRDSYFDGEELPSGVTLVITPMASGSGDPDLDSAIAALGEEHYNVWAVPYTSAALLTSLETELEDRWGPTRQIGACAFTAIADTHSAAGTLGDSRNSEHVSILSTYKSPTPPWEWVGAEVADVAREASKDPARPFQTLGLSGILPPKVEDRFTQDERNLLLYDGISTNYVDSGGTVRIERLITTYKKNDLGADDIAFLNVNTVFTLERLRWELRNRMLLKYPRHKLADDGTRYAPGQAVVTPSVIKAEVISLFRSWEERALVEAPEQFAQDLIVERDGADPDRVNIQMSPDLVNQLRVGAAKISFILN